MVFKIQWVVVASQHVSTTVSRRRRLCGSRRETRARKYAETRAQGASTLLIGVNCLASGEEVDIKRADACRSERSRERGGGSDIANPLWKRDGPLWKRTSARPLTVRAKRKSEITIYAAPIRATKTNRDISRWKQAGEYSRGSLTGNRSA